MAATVTEVLLGSTVEVAYSPIDGPAPVRDARPHTVQASGPGPAGWTIEFTVGVTPRFSSLAEGKAPPFAREALVSFPAAAVRTATAFRGAADAGVASAAIVRAVRDAFVAELLSDVLASHFDRGVSRGLVEDTLDFLIELSGTRVESHDLTHGVVITNVLRDEPRLQFRYPSDVRSAKRAPLLFDGERSVLIVDLDGRARTELQRHRIERLGSTVDAGVTSTEEFVESGSLVAEATRRLGGLGLFLRGDRTIHVFVDGQPLLLRRGEHWTAFPFGLNSALGSVTDGGAAAELVSRAALMISGQRHGAILAIVPGSEVLDGVVPLKDRYDLRDEIDREAMRTETRLHHLIDAAELDEHTLTRLAVLDGATIVDRDGHLLAYGAIVVSSDSQHEGARTAAAKTLSQWADVVLKVSVDGDITIFRDGSMVTTLLGQATQR